MKWHNIFCYHYEPGFLWFRAFGMGLCIKDKKEVSNVDKL